MIGPGTQEQWLYWKYPTEEQKKRQVVRAELEKILLSNYVSESIEVVDHPEGCFIQPLSVCDRFYSMMSCVDLKNIVV